MNVRIFPLANQIANTATAILTRTATADAGSATRISSRRLMTGRGLHCYLLVPAMGSFFSDGEATDVAYVNIRAGGDKWLDGARVFVEELWNTYEPYADATYLEEAKRAFHPRFWEMYLTCALLDSGVALVPRSARQVRIAGPDIQTSSPRVWIEGVAPNRGTGADAVPELELGVARNVPDDAISLRLLGSIRDKLLDRKRYIDSQIMDPCDPYVIAVNGADIPSARKEREVPRIVRALFPIGCEQVHVDPVTFEVTRRSHAYRAEIAKKSKATVPTTLFQEPSSAGLSAVIYSNVDACNRSNLLGGDFIVVRNTRAANTLPEGVCRRGVMYWENDGMIQNRTL